MQYKISNEYIKIEVIDFGAELCSLQKKNEDLEYIWQGDKRYWNRHAPILFPIVGKLLDDEYSYKNKIYSMTQHGFARDSLFELFSLENDSICLKLESSESTMKIYPFEFALYVTYTLVQSSVNISYKVVNKSDENIYFSIGSHPAFNWPLTYENKNEYYMEFQKTEFLERLPLTLTGISKQKKILNLDNNKLYLTEKLFEEDAIVIQNLENKIITFKNTQDKKFIELTFDGFYLGIWSKPTGAPFVCIEPWHGLADFTTHNKKIEEKIGMINLKKNKTFKTYYKISV